jgi:hypothetical protein
MDTFYDTIDSNVWITQCPVIKMVIKSLKCWNKIVWKPIALKLSLIFIKTYKHKT